jgi:hypothetical protein
MNVMNLSLWWLALPVLLLPILWHRQKREQTKAAPLASARFLPVSEPKQLRVWRWSDPLLLLLRCLMLLALIALLADLVLAWRGDSVLVAPGTDASFVQQQALDAGFKDAQQLVLLDHDVIGWLHAHEREFKPEARLLVVGDAVMPAVLPRMRHAVTLRTNAKPAAALVERHVAVFSEHADDWRRLFAAAKGGWNVVVDTQPGPRTELLVWDRPEPAPATLRAPLWWVTDAHTFPELDQAARVDGMRVTETPRGRVWQIAGWPPREPEAARAVFAAWQRLHLAPQPYTAPAQALSAEPNAPAGPASGALREILATLLVALFVLERMLTHARRR